VARDIRRPTTAARGSRAGARARRPVPRRARAGAAAEPASDHAQRDTPPRTHTASRLPTPPPRTSSGIRCIDDACPERAPSPLLGGGDRWVTIPPALAT